LPSGAWTGSEARLIITFYLRFRDICIYMSVCTCIAQDRAHLTQVLSRWLNVQCPSKHLLLFGAPLSEVSLSLGMADGASSAEDSPDDDSNLSRTCTATRRRKHPDNDSNLSRTCTATGHRKRPDDDSDLGCTPTTTIHRKRSSSQTAAQWEERLPAE